MPNKTQAMFKMLTDADFSPGNAIDEIARKIDINENLDVGSLPSAFTRAIYTQSPELRDVAREFEGAGAPGVAISGAGPTHYTLVEHAHEAFNLAERLEQRLAGSARIVACKTLARTPLPVRDNR
jgi:4-diphosphocytidyl-2C-methyl-D-erythritol kinase